MKRIRLFTILALIAAFFAVVGSASAQIAYNAPFTTSITYQNVGTGTATIVFQFYPENNGTPVSVPKTLAEGAGGSLYVGSLTEVAAGFNGSVVMSSDVPVVATLVQISGDSAVKNRPLSNGFSSGASEYLLATVLKNQFSTSSRFSVQNASSTSVDVTINLFNADNTAAPPIVVTQNNLPAGAAKYFDMGQLSQVTAASFNGSATITAVESGTSTPANIVASVLELSTSADAASSFEGVTGGSNTVYMASALCSAFGASSAYAVQNTSATTTATVTVTYSNSNGSGSEVANIAPGAKRSFLGCTANNAGYSGSATITAVQQGTSNPADVVAIGKVFGSGNSTAFVGADSGSSMLALPYARYSVSQFDSGARQRTFFAIQNVGSALGSGAVVVKYLNINGAVVATHTLGAMATGQKLNTNALHPSVVLSSGFTQADLDEFGYIAGFGGAVVVEGPPGSELVAIARVQSKTTTGVVGEDYSGIPIQ